MISNPLTLFPDRLAVARYTKHRSMCWLCKRLATVDTFRRPSGNGLTAEGTALNFLSLLKRTLSQLSLWFSLHWLRRIVSCRMYRRAVRSI
jgi:hypothetical protein